MNAKTKKTLMERSRQRRQNAGLVRVEVQILPKDKQALANFVNDDLGGIYKPRGVKNE